MCGNRTDKPYRSEYCKSLSCTKRYLKTISYTRLSKGLIKQSIQHISNRPVGPSFRLFISLTDLNGSHMPSIANSTFISFRPNDERDRDGTARDFMTYLPDGIRKTKRSEIEQNETK